MNVKVTMLNSL